MEPVEHPANRLTIGNQQIKVIEAEFVFRIQNASHHAVNGESRDGYTALLARRPNDEVLGRIIIDCVDHDADYIPFA
jgi:hypothetical protein